MGNIILVHKTIKYLRSLLNQSYHYFQLRIFQQQWERQHPPQLSQAQTKSTFITIASLERVAELQSEFENNSYNLNYSPFPKTPEDHLKYTDEVGIQLRSF